MSYGWLQAVDEAMVTAHLGVADESDSYETAKRKLGELIDWHVAVATDPRVNGGWQLVPVEADANMMEVLTLGNHVTAPRRWRDTLAVAPKPGG